MNDPMKDIHAHKKTLQTKFRQAGLFEAYGPVVLVQASMSDPHYVVTVNRELDAAEKAKIGDDVVTDQGSECTVVTVSDQTNPAILPTLPQIVGQEKIRYGLSGTQQARPAAPGCGQLGHQCVCGTPPKP